MNGPLVYVGLASGSVSATSWHYLRADCSATASPCTPWPSPPPSFSQGFSGVVCDAASGLYVAPAPMSGCLSANSVSGADPLLLAAIALPLCLLVLLSSAQLVLTLRRRG